MISIGGLGTVTQFVYPMPLIAPTHRDQGVLASMLTEIQGRKVPVLASVKNGNHLGSRTSSKNLALTLNAPQQVAGAISISGSRHRATEWRTGEGALAALRFWTTVRSRIMI